MEDVEKKEILHDSKTPEQKPAVLPGFTEGGPNTPKKGESWTNVIVFALVAACMLPFFLWGDYIFRTTSEEHFLLHLPLNDFESLQPILDSAEPPRSSEFMNKSFFIILWGPWDEPSCELLHQLDPLLRETQKNPDFKVIPIVYFAQTTAPVNWYEMDGMARERFLNQKKEEQQRLDRFVKLAFQNRGFHFEQVWWDPVDRFRLDLMEMASQESLKLKRKVDGIGFPTVIYAENGVIQRVWTSGTTQDLEEMKEVLKILRTGHAGAAK